MDAQEYIDKIAQGRGFVLDFHKVMAKHDYDTLVATDNLTRTAILSERSLDMRTKELLFIVSLVAVRGDRADTIAHMRNALRIGVTPQEILEALEILLPLAGVVLFKEGFEIWQEVTEADGIEPSVDGAAAPGPAASRAG
jgi:4-carboxymuconolactone decarboxylase